ncbi:MAG TPA: nickel-binding protein [Rudaea sp.]
MPLYMDIHNVAGATADDLAKAHAADLKVQVRHGVQCLKYWFNEPAGKVFCLFDAPSADAANAVHREAHGLLAEKIIEVDPDMGDGFLGGGEINPAGAVLLPGVSESQRDPGIRSVLFTDIVGSTELTQRVGDDAAMEVVNLHDSIVRAALASAGGREVKHTGDGIMASFISAVAAVRCGMAIQDSLAIHRATGTVISICVRIGVAAGEPVEQRHDLFGSTVQLAARLCAAAEPDQVLISNVVAELCMGKGLHFHDLGEVVLKGFGQPVRVHATAKA